MDSEKFKNWALGILGIGGAVAIIIGLVVTIAGYLAPIKSNIEFIPSINDGITRVEQNTKILPSINDSITRVEQNTKILPSINDGITRMEQNTKILPSMSKDITFLKERTRALILPTGGRLTTLDRFFTIDLKPGFLPKEFEEFEEFKEFLLEYVWIDTEKLPTLPDGFKSVGYSFALTPYSLYGSQLPSFVLELPAEISIVYTNPILNLTPKKPTDLILLRWDEKKAKWIPIETVLQEEILRAKTTELSLFTLGFVVP